VITLVGMLCLPAYAMSNRPGDFMEEVVPVECDSVEDWADRLQSGKCYGCPPPGTETATATYLGPSYIVCDRIQSYNVSGAGNLTFVRELGQIPDAIVTSANLTMLFTKGDIVITVDSSADSLLAANDLYVSGASFKTDKVEVGGRLMIAAEALFIVGISTPPAPHVAARETDSPAAMGAGVGSPSPENLETWQRRLDYSTLSAVKALGAATEGAPPTSDAGQLSKVTMSSANHILVTGASVLIFDGLETSVLASTESAVIIGAELISISLNISGSTQMNVSTLMTGVALLGSEYPLTFSTVLATELTVSCSVALTNLTVYRSLLIATGEVVSTNLITVFGNLSCSGFLEAVTLNCTLGEVQFAHNAKTNITTAYFHNLKLISFQSAVFPSLQVTHKFVRLDISQVDNITISSPISVEQDTLLSKAAEVSFSTFESSYLEINESVVSFGAVVVKRAVIDLSSHVTFTSLALLSSEEDDTPRKFSVIPEIIMSNFPNYTTLTTEKMIYTVAHANTKLDPQFDTYVSDLSKQPCVLTVGAGVLLRCSRVDACSVQLMGDISPIMDTALRPPSEEEDSHHPEGVQAEDDLDEKGDRGREGTEGSDNSARSPRPQNDLDGSTAPYGPTTSTTASYKTAMNITRLLYVGPSGTATNSHITFANTMGLIGNVYVRTEATFVVEAIEIMDMANVVQTKNSTYSFSQEDLFPVTVMVSLHVGTDAKFSGLLNVRHHWVKISHITEVYDLMEVNKDEVTCSPFGILRAESMQIEAENISLRCRIELRSSKLTDPTMMLDGYVVSLAGIRILSAPSMKREGNCCGGSYTEFGGCTLGKPRAKNGVNISNYTPNDPAVLSGYAGDTCNGIQGGAGGGSAIIRAQSRIMLEDIVLADGEQGDADLIGTSTQCGGSGAGGALYLQAPEIGAKGFGMLSASGGGCYQACIDSGTRCGGGSPGQIIVYGSAVIIDVPGEDSSTSGEDTRFRRGASRRPHSGSLADPPEDDENLVWLGPWRRFVSHHMVWPNHLIRLEKNSSIYVRNGAGNCGEYSAHDTVVVCSGLTMISDDGLECTVPLYSLVFVLLLAGLVLSLLVYCAVCISGCLRKRIERAKESGEELFEEQELIRKFYEGRGTASPGTYSSGRVHGEEAEECEEWSSGI